MAEEKPAEVPPSGATAADDEEEETPGYKAPAKVDLATIQQLDADDEALVKYKQALLGKTEDVVDEGGNNVILKKMALVIDGRPDVEIDLTGDLTKFRENPIVIKEGVQYRIKIEFRVQREIVAGLRYFQTLYRKGIKVGKNNHMVGSYGPKTEHHTFQTPLDEAPSGMIARGRYNAKSKFTDDDKNIYLEWDWSLEIKKDWVD